MPRVHDEPEDDEDGDDYDAETDYDPDDPETYPAGLYVHGDERAAIPCPHCQAEIDEESEQCPKCGTFISSEDAPGGGPPRWAVVLALVLLVAMALALMG